MINKTYQAVRNWSNANQGLLTLIGVLIALISIIRVNVIDLNITDSFLNKIWLLITYGVRIPVYLLIAIILVGLIYFLRLKGRYKRKGISINLLKGIWKNEWTINGNTCSEILQITGDGKYYINGEHCFNVDQFNYDEKKKQIRFIKDGVRETDKRKLLNVVKVVNNELLVGTENNYSVKYTKISD